MDVITDPSINESQMSESWFEVMDPISIADVCKNDLEQWSILKKNEKYLTVHQDLTSFSMSDTFPSPSETRVQDSICVYKERMAKGHHHIHHRMLSKLNRFNTTSYGSIAPFTDRLAEKLKAYRQRLDSESSDLTSEQLLSLEKELSTTVQIVQQKLRSHGNTTSEKSTNSSGKTSLNSRASDLSKKAAKKVSKSLCASMLCTAAENNTTPRPKAISRPSWTSTTSKIATKFRNFVDKQPQQSPKNSIESVTTDPPNTPTSPVTFSQTIWKLSPGRSTASLKPALKKTSTSSQPPSPRSRAHSSNGYTQEQPFERREWIPSENVSPCTSIGPDDPSDCQQTERGYWEFHSEHCGWDVRKISTASSGSEYNRPLGWDLSNPSVAYSASHYSRSVSD